jgi:N,N-dimethylformamidase
MSFEMMENQPGEVPRIIGYVTPWSGHAGQDLAFKVSSRGARSFVAQVQRVDCCDPNPLGPGMKLVSVDVPLQASYVGEEQSVFAGSCAVGPISVPADARQITVEFTIRPTTSNVAPQTLLSLQNADGEGGFAVVRIGGSIGFRDLQTQEVVDSGLTVPIDRWTRLQISLDRSGRVHTSIAAVIAYEPPAAAVESDVSCTLTSNAFEATTICVAATWKKHPEAVFDGFIESPSIYVTRTGATASVSSQSELIAHWDFRPSLEHERVPNTLDANEFLTLVNSPLRAVRSSSWTGEEMNWKYASDQYGAIRFHSDDLDDCKWQTSLTLRIPAELPSGIYCLRVDNGDGVDSIPFYVTVAPGCKRERIVFLAPTLTYLAYANNARGNFSGALAQRVQEWGGYPHNPDIVTMYGLSTYNDHSDGSGIHLSSRLRPVLTMRPGYLTFLDDRGSGLRHFSADSHLTNWLREKHFDFDVITDEDLDDQGVDALKHYDVVLTGSHPEYHTRRMLGAILAYRAAGGSLMYLGGNGFYWKIARPQSAPHMLEIRRAEGGMRVWASEPGEYYHQLDGEYGGMWRRNGLPPQTVAGVGFTAEGDFKGTHYVRAPASFTSEFEWLFDGVNAGPGEPIGKHGLSGGGAAGFEIDQSATDLGTPDFVSVVAYSENHDESYKTTPDEILTPDRIAGKPRQFGGTRAHMVCGLAPHGGALFAVGSICFLGSLFNNGEGNDASTIVENCLRYFLVRSHSGLRGRIGLGG